MPRLALVLTALALLLGGCGQKGPLYLPQPEPDNATQAAEPAQDQRSEQAAD
ncbi:MAG: lipoprotein [Spongiibacteraceae bacterium]|jgi:predicted small lipoprotein YifL|nr:lipoprotein [Spongiibacteraceae bacterium]